MRKLVAFLIAFSLVSVMPVSNVAAAKGDPQQELIELAAAHVTVDSDGMFVIQGSLTRTERKSLEAVFTPLNKELRTVERHMRPTVRQTASKGPGVSAPVASLCGYVPKWALQAFAWYVILVGGYSAIVGLFASATIVGLPAGAVLGAIGVGLSVTGSFLLWWIDNNIPPWGKYVCIF